MGSGGSVVKGMTFAEAKEQYSAEEIDGYMFEQVAKTTMVMAYWKGMNEDEKPAPAYLPEGTDIPEGEEGDFIVYYAQYGGLRDLERLGDKAKAVKWVAMTGADVDNQFLATHNKIAALKNFRDNQAEGAAAGNMAANDKDEDGKLNLDEAWNLAKAVANGLMRDSAEVIATVSSSDVFNAAVFSKFAGDDGNMDAKQVAKMFKLLANIGIDSNKILQYGCMQWHTTNIMADAMDLGDLVLAAQGKDKPFLAYKPSDVEIAAGEEGEFKVVWADDPSRAEDKANKWMPLSDGKDDAMALVNTGLASLTKFIEVQADGIAAHQLANNDKDKDGTLDLKEAHQLSSAMFNFLFAKSGAPGIWAMLKSEEAFDTKVFKKVAGKDGKMDAKELATMFKFLGYRGKAGFMAMKYQLESA